MVKFDFAAAIRSRPSDAELPRALGIFRYRNAYDRAGKATGAVIPDPAWARQNIVRVDTSQFAGFPKYPSGKPAGVIDMHRLVAPVFEATMQLAAERGLLQRLHEFNGCYVPRHMGWNVGRPLSVHSWGAAFDVDASTNGYGVPLSGMKLDRDFIRLLEECGWTWGGRWTGSYADGMHWQWTDPLPGTQVMPWQDAMARSAAPIKPVPALPLTRRVLIDGRPAGEGRTVYAGVVIQRGLDNSLWLQPDDGNEKQLATAADSALQGNSTRVTLLDPGDVWVPFVGRAIYRGLMLNLNLTTGDLWIRQATDAEKAGVRPAPALLANK